jgi:hypothetical protein
MSLATSRATAGIIGFEDLTTAVPPCTNYTGPGGGQYYDGSDGAGGFVSGGVEFANNYNAAYGSWDGWSYSNTTDTGTAGYTNQYSAYTGGAKSGSNYGIYYEPWTLAPTVTGFPPGSLAGAYITNTTYAALSMLNGDSFAKKFGGDNGNDPDWFLLTITGKDASDAVTGTVDFYLADYRFSDNSQDYIVGDWTWVDFAGLGNAAKLQFDLSSSDVGQWGMNTPAYFAMDDLGTEAVPEPATLVMFAIGGVLCGTVAFVRRRSGCKSSKPRRAGHGC